MTQLSHCIFEWDEVDLDLLKTAKKAVLEQEGVLNPSPRAVTKALTREDMARLCWRRTRGTKETVDLIEQLLLSLAPATDSLGVKLLKKEMDDIWAEQKRHIKCIQDPPNIPLYTITGHLRYCC